MPETIKSLFQRWKEEHIKDQDFQCAAAVRELQDVIDPDGRIPLDDAGSEKIGNAINTLVGAIREKR